MVLTPHFTRIKKAEKAKLSRTEREKRLLAAVRANEKSIEDELRKLRPAKTPSGGSSCHLSETRPRASLCPVEAF